MNIRAGRLGVALLAVTALPAAAQETDGSGRYDIGEVLHRHAHDPSQLPTREEAGGRPVTFQVSAAATGSTNPGPARSAEVTTAFATPGFAVDITPIAVAGWDVGGGAMIDADYYSGDYNDRFGEGRLESFAFASHSLGPGTATATFITHGVYTNDFSDRFFQLWISSLGYSVTRGAFTFRGTAEYEDADVPEERRTRLATTVGYAFPKPTWGYDVSLEGSLAFSDFNGGANANRNDVLAGLALTADRKFGRGWALEWEAALINRFSNRDRSRFTAVDVGVELAKRF